MVISSKKILRPNSHLIFFCWKPWYMVWNSSIHHGFKKKMIILPYIVVFASVKIKFQNLIKGPSKKSRAHGHVTKLISALSLGRVWTLANHVVQTIFSNSEIFSRDFSIENFGSERISLPKPYKHILCIITQKTPPCRNNEWTLENFSNFENGKSGFTNC